MWNLHILIETSCGRDVKVSIVICPGQFFYKVTYGINSMELPSFLKKISIYIPFVFMPAFYAFIFYM